MTCLQFDISSGIEPVGGVIVVCNNLEKSVAEENTPEIREETDLGLQEVPSESKFEVSP